MVYSSKKTNEVLRQARIEHGLNQADLAKLIGVSPTAVYAYERGGACPNSYDVAQKLASELGRDVNELFPHYGAGKDEYFNYALLRSRRASGLTFKELSERVGVSVVSLFKYERLAVMPNPAVAQRYAQLLGKDVAELFPPHLRLIMREVKRERNHPIKTIIRKLKKNKGLDSHVRKARIATLESILNPRSLEELPEDVLAINDDPEYKAMCSELKDCVLNLPEVHREAIDLHYFHSLKLYEISDALGIPVGTVKSRLYVAIQRLRASFCRREDGSSIDAAFLGGLYFKFLQRF